MELLFNDLSIHGQFPDVEAFRGAIDRVMAIRELARRRYGRELQCHRNVAHAQVTRDSSMPRAIQGLSKDKRSALMQWLARSGPFWEDFRRHGGGDWLECKGEVVTDTAAGEAAYRLFHGIGCGLVSMNPSAWLSSPLPVDWREERGSARSIGVPNYWDAESPDGRSRCSARIACIVDEPGDGGANTLPRSDVFTELLRAVARTPVRRWRRAGPAIAADRPARPQELLR